MLVPGITKVDEAEKSAKGAFPTVIRLVLVALSVPYVLEAARLTE